MEIPIIIEIASNHEGNIDRFDKYIWFCKGFSNAELKYQIFNCESLCHDSYRFKDDLEIIEIKFQDWEKIIYRTLNQDINLWLEPFDKSSLEFLLGLNQKHKLSIKLPSCDVPHVDPQLLGDFYRVGLAIGGLKIKEIENILPKFKNSIKNLILFHGYQAFPTSIADRNFERLNYIKEYFNLPVYYADHTEASTNELIISTLLESFYYGSNGLERHICLSYKDKFDTVSASDLNQFEKICKFFQNKKFKERDFKIMKNQKIPPMSNSEINYRESMLKKVVLKCSLNKGKILSKDVLSFKRCTTDKSLLSIKILELLKNKKLITTKDLKFNHVLTESDIIAK